VAYPETYDELEGIPAGDCAIYAHVLTDGIIDTQEDIASDSNYCVFAIYGTATPKVSIIDPQSDKLLVDGLEGEYKENSGLHVFCVDVPALGSAGDDEDSEWKIGSAILKVHSDDSPLEFKKHVRIVEKACTTAEMCATMDKAIDKIGEIQTAEAEQNEKIYTMANGITLRAIH